jgi:hypothetical protein
MKKIGRITLFSEPTEATITDLNLDLE